MAASFAKTAGQHTRMTRFKPTALLLTLCMSLSVLWHAYHPLQVVGQPSNSYSQPHSQQQNRQQLLESKVREVQAKEGLQLAEYHVDHPPSNVVESSYECTEGPNVSRVCFFNNVFLWQGEVWFVSSNEGIELPNVAIDFRVISSHAFLQPKRISPEAMIAAMQSAKAVVDWSSPKDEVHVWSGAVRNYGHFMGEDMPSLHNTLCKYLGRCAPGNTSGLHLVLRRQNMYKWPGYVDTAIACLAESRLVNMLAPEMQDTLFVVRSLLTGVGPDCRAAIFCRGYDKTGISGEQYTLYRDRIAQCMGFDATASAPILPKMKFIVVDRLYTSGRHFLNIQEAMKGLEERYGEIADVELHYMENRTLIEQAHLWNRASVAIHMHGASLGNWAFLPHTAAGVHVTLDHIGDPFPIHFEQDLKSVTNVSAVLVNVNFHPYVVLRIRQFERTREWREELTVEDKIQILEKGSCQNISKPDVPGELTCEMKYLLKGFDMELPLGQLYNAVDEAVRLVYDKQGRTPPNWIGSRPEGGDSNSAADVPDNGPRSAVDGPSSDSSGGPSGGPASSWPSSSSGGGGPSSSNPGDDRGSSNGGPDPANSNPGADRGGRSLEGPGGAPGGTNPGGDPGSSNAGANPVSSSPSSPGGGPGNSLTAPSA